MTTIPIPGWTRSIALLAALLLSQTGCAPREGYGVRDGGLPWKQSTLWRTAEATLFVSAGGPSTPDASFAIPNLNAKRAEIRLEALSRHALEVRLRCRGAAMIRRPEAAAIYLPPGRVRQVTLAPRGQRTPTLDWRPSSGTCRVEGGDGHGVTLRPESEALPQLAELSRAPLDCRPGSGAPRDPLQHVFLDGGVMLQTCPVAPGAVAFHTDPLEALNARIEALTGSTVPRASLSAGDPDLPLDFSRAPRLDLIQLAYLHMRADFVGYLTARMVVYHAMRGTQVRILVTGLLMTEKDRLFYNSLAARHPNIQVQYYEWSHPGISGPDDVVNRIHRVQHARSFLALSPDRGQSRYIFGGRNLHDGFFFSSPLDLRDWPYLHTYDDNGFQGFEFYSVYEDVEADLRDDRAIRNIAAHQIALWNRDAETQQVGPVRAGNADPVAGMRHYLSLPWADGRDQIRWFVGAIDAAQKEVLIVTPYLNPPPQIQAALERAEARGVPVRMVVRLDSTDPAGFVITALNRRYAATYSGLFEIEEYFPRPRMMHTKLIVIDRRLAVLTSTNLDHRAFWHDTENGLIFLDTPQVSALLDIVDDYRKTSRVLRPDEPEHPLGEVIYGWSWLRSVF